MVSKTIRSSKNQDLSPTKQGDYENSISIGGRMRTYLLHIPPAYDHAKPLPLVIVLHGGGGNARSMAHITDFSRKADREGFIVVYPNGTGRLKTRLLTWNAGNCCGYAHDKNVEDVEFIRTLIEKLEQAIKIDTRRIYATGISNGGMMTYCLACRLSDKIAAIAPVAGALNIECEPIRSVSVIIFHGTDDKDVLYRGGKPIRKWDWHDRSDTPVYSAVDFWIINNGIKGIPATSEKGNVLIQTYAGGKNDSEVVLVTIKGGGHAWPGGWKAWFLGDEPIGEINATDMIWEFFKKTSKNVIQILKTDKGQGIQEDKA